MERIVSDTAVLDPCGMQSYVQKADVFQLIVPLIIIIIIIIIISFMKGIYTHIPETNYVPREYSVAAILLFLFMVLTSLVSVLNLLYFYISAFRSIIIIIIFPLKGVLVHHSVIMFFMLPMPSSFPSVVRTAG